jgi:putative ABC transport system permease protein
MNKNYFKVAIRNLLRNKGYTIINLSGLAVGIAACILIMLFVKSEWSYDKFHSKADRLYRLWLEEKEAEDKIFTETVTPIPLGPALQNSIPEIESTCRVYSFHTNLKTNTENKTTAIATIVDESFFNLFDFKIDEGNSQNPFPTPGSVILTSEYAKKYFGNSSPLGQIIQLELNDTLVPFTVTAIVNNVPEESSIRFNLLIPFSNAHYIWSERTRNAWHQIFNETYALMKAPVVPDAFTDKFEKFAKQVLGNNYRPGTYNLHLQPITDIHLNNTLPEGIQPVSSPVYSYVLSAIGIIILIIACFNFITLSVARSTTRAMEVGVRKVLGADRKQLVIQFWTETFLFTVSAVALGVLLAFLFTGPFNNLFQKNLSISFNFSLVSFLLSLTIFIAFFAGIYPAVVLSGFNPTEVFKGKSRTINSRGKFRHALIALQFVASICLITCTIVVSRQMNYIQSKNLGYEKDRVIIVQTNKADKEGSRLAELYKEELKKLPQVKSTSVSLYTLEENSWIGVGFTDAEKKYREFFANIIDADFLQTMKIELIAGRNFKQDKSDAQTSIIINEAMAKEFGWKDAVGKRFPGKFNAEVIGVVKDFNYQSLHSKIEPLMLASNADPINRGIENISISYPPQSRISVLMQGGSLKENVDMLEQAWKRIEKVQRFDYNFLDESLAAQYADEERSNKIILLASGISIFIACMGLFGLATLIVNRRVKEIGIRKILGAHALSIVKLVSKEFVIIVCVAAVIAFPIAWYAMNKWLEDFAYRITISWWMLLLSATIALLITLVTVGFQALRAAMVNPVNSLRTE